MQIPVLNKGDNRGCLLAGVLVLLTVALLASFYILGDIISPFFPKHTALNIGSSVQCMGTTIQIQNNSDRDWARMQLVLSALSTHAYTETCEYIFLVEHLPAGTSYQVDLKQFRRSSGGTSFHAPDQFDPSVLQPVQLLGEGREKGLFGKSLVFRLEAPPVVVNGQVNLQPVLIRHPRR